MSTWYFFYQVRGKEDTWNLSLSSERLQVVRDLKPAFSTVLDLSSVPEDNDWTKVRYRGPLYFDFDADGDLELACAQFQSFLGKLDLELGFDISQASLFASGSKGFHIEIPQECFMPKLPATGTPWLPYIYRSIAESLMVDTLDLNVYTGKRGRMWRTPNVKRENGMHKVPLTLDEALTMTPELYADVIAAPRQAEPPTPAYCNSKFAMLFERSRQKMTEGMRTKKKRQAQANAILDPWKKAKKHPPTIEKVMAGEDLADTAGFQAIAMQLAIYAASVEMPLDDFLARCQGVCDRHVSDSRRYNTVEKRRDELARMWQYMGENALYDFDTGPILGLLKKGTSAPDLGAVETEDSGDRKAPDNDSDTDTEDGDAPDPTVALDLHKTVRKGFFMNGEGMFKKFNGNVDCICRATLRQVEPLIDLEKHDFKGYEFDLVTSGSKPRRCMLGSDAFTSALKMRQFFAAHQLTYQGGEPETAALLDIMSEKAQRGGHVYVYPREGFFIINHPAIDVPTPVKVYLTQDTFLSSVSKDDPDYFTLRYRPVNALSNYLIDVHKAPDLDATMIPAIRDLLTMNKPSILADMLGWMVACHYRSAYLRLFSQFPLLQIYAEAGAGKSKSVEVLAHLHWYHKERISIKSAMSSTNFALDTDASTSHSAPLIIDEFKPRELRMQRDKYSKLKDVFKACYIGSDIGNRGTLNKGAENSLGTIKSKCTAPIVFMAEAIESETAIYERCVTVGLNSSFLTDARRAAHGRLMADPSAVSALGKAIVQMGFLLNLEGMRTEVLEIQAKLEAALPALDDDAQKRAAPRLVFNRAVILHALSTLKRVLQRHFEGEFDADVDELINARSGALQGEEATVSKLQGMSEISKVISRIALMTRDRDQIWEMRMGSDYLPGDGWVELRVERAYDKYRRYCASIHDTPLFDNVDAFVVALASFTATLDNKCAASELRAEESTENIVRLSVTKLKKLGVQTFRS